MRLELTSVCSLNGFQLLMGLYRGHSTLFLRVCFDYIDHFFELQLKSLFILNFVSGFLKV